MEKSACRRRDKIANILLPGTGWDDDRLCQSIAAECQTPLPVLFADDFDIRGIDRSSVDLTDLYPTRLHGITVYRYCRPRTSCPCRSCIDDDRTGEYSLVGVCYSRIDCESATIIAIV